MARQIQISLPATGEEEWLACKEPLLSGWLTQGPIVRSFEEAFASRHDVRHALATTSCTTALHLILAAMGIGPGDEVIVPSFTWVATANVVIYCGATPVLVDVDPLTNNVSFRDVVEKLTSRTRAVICVHLFGLPVDVPALRSLLPANVAIVEDAACAAGARLRGVSVGALGDAAAFSFHPRKSITTGEGGMITTDRAELAELADSLRNHGASVSEEQRHLGPRPYLLPEFNLLGFNYRMTDIQGAIGLTQLRKLDRFIEERQRWAEFYREQLSSLPWLRLPSWPDGSQHAWQAFVTYVEPERAPLARNALMERLKEAGVAARPGTHAIHMLGYYRDRFGFEPDDFPGARDCAAHTMALPLHNRMSADDYEHIVSTLHAIK